MKKYFPHFLFSFFAVPLCAEELIDFNRDIRPLLSNRCFACHGPDEAERAADLRLDTREGALTDLGGYAALAPGNTDESELFYRINLDADHEDLMPPEGKGEKFTDAEVALIKRWIEQDGPYANHWSYEKPERPEIPKGKRSDWPKNEIDYFVLARLESEGLEPAAEADRYTLARRSSLDLIGLPPSWDEVIAFVNDPSSNAYETYIDSLLAKPAFGEHWGRAWLDLARYADSAGYADDRVRTIWAYRDYVIKAFNANMPFDQFTIEQIAGDLLDNPSRDQLIATAFHRNTMTNSEGGTNDEEFRNEAVVDRVNTTMSTWMGTTMACAQCHTHKYDPLTHAEYFQLFDFFNQSEDADHKDELPILDLWSKKQEQDKQKWRGEISRLSKVIKTPTPELAAAEIAWREKLNREPAWSSLKPAFARADAMALSIDDQGKIEASGEAAETDRYRVEFALPEDPVSLSALRLEIPPEQISNFVLSSLNASWIPSKEQKPKARFVRVSLPGKDRILHLAEIEVFSGETNLAPAGTATQSSIGSGGEAKRVNDGNTDGLYASGSVAHTAKEANPWLEIDLGEARLIDRVVVWNRTDGNNGERLKGFEVSLLDEKRETVWKNAPTELPAPNLAISTGGPMPVTFDAAYATHEQKGFEARHVLAAKPDPAKGWAIAGGTGIAQKLTLTKKSPMTLAGGKLILTLPQQSKHRQHLLRHFSFSMTDSKNISNWASLPGEIRDLLRQGAMSWTKKESAQVASYYRSIAPSLRDERTTLARLEKQLAEAKPETTVPIMRDLPPEKHRKSFVQLRGSYLSPGEEVSAGVPAVFHPLEEGVKRDRLALAKWLIDDDNPLTARVIANRYWEELFGIGIVETSEEFGSQGELPSHPDLLDWLAVEFQEGGWDMKKLLRKIVLSATYRQSSKTSPQRYGADPYNRTLSRGPRFRLSAEQIRDNALAVSGLLSDKMFGRPVNPPQPEMGLKAAFGSATDWVDSNGEDRYRRAIYTSWRRSNPYPSMATFDAPNREVCTVRRGRTNTPLQSLVTLNDPVYVEAAQALGRRAINHESKSLEEKITFAIRESLAREPNEGEVSRLRDLYESARIDYEPVPDMATKIATIPLGPLPEEADVLDHAAWTIVSNVILNLDEVFLKR